ncbi:hypothetical protein [Glutamicibacter nicotianae]|uniref:phage terminase small subunit n=1 Tax=Glutamicibacter nicotianae TaxID=37929 RepID=UPI0025554186|nr:hypothetical protein [Glutamicibacter nicotianae]WIV44524.1 hypothetical protein QQS42_02580 [Glutamicibacter nicotianae]
MGTRGPVPKRSGDRNGHRSKDEAQAVTSVDLEGEVVIPDADPEWHPIAQDLWESLEKSGQARFYEPSDWAIAYSLCDDLSYYKLARVRSGQMLASIMSALSSLLLTEGDRRRVQVELNRKQPDEGEDENVTRMDKWKQKLG